MTDWQPTIDLERLHARAAAFDVVRAFFRGHGYLEVDTPILSRDVVVDAHLEPFVVRWQPESGRDGGERFLQTSPEFHMKRLVAAGATAIWQASRVMRQGELGRWHLPEFTMLEWYRVGDTHHEQMTFTEELVAAIQTTERPFERLTYDEAFERHAGTRVLVLSPAELVDLAGRHDVHLPAELDREDRDGLLNVLLFALVEPHLGKMRPTFLYDYPATQAALARIRNDDPPVAERFELYVEGIEIANGYHELTDADELRRRNADQQRLRGREGYRPLPTESRLLDAMEHGLPACAGVALGFDRLLAYALGATDIAEVVPFPFERA